MQLVSCSEQLLYRWAHIGHQNGIGVILTLGTIAALGYSLSMISVLVPPLLMILTLSYSMYVVSDLRDSGQQQDAERGRADMLRKVALPVLLAGLTTAIGFSSLALSDLRAIQT